MANAREEWLKNTLEKNFLKLNNGQMAKYEGEDDWNRRLYRFEDDKIYCLLNNEQFYTITPNYGEPDIPLSEKYQPVNIRLYDDAQSTQISLEDWESYFEPITEEESDQYFPFYDDAKKYVESKFSNKPYQHIWSIVEGDSGKMILLNGYHKVNVLDYLVCKIPWGIGEESDADVYVEVDYEGN